MANESTLLFEDAVFGAIAKGKSRVARVAAEVDFENLVTAELLNFAALKAADQNMRIAAVERGYRVDFSRARVAFDFMNILSRDNPSVSLEFTDDLLNYTPDADLVRKSKVPLWVIQQVGPQSVIIKRMW